MIHAYCQQVLEIFSLTGQCLGVETHFKMICKLSSINALLFVKGNTCISHSQTTETFPFGDSPEGPIFITKYMFSRARKLQKQFNPPEPWQRPSEIADNRNLITFCFEMHAIFRSSPLCSLLCFAEDNIHIKVNLQSLSTHQQKVVEDMGLKYALWSKRY